MYCILQFIIAEIHQTTSHISRVTTETVVDLKSHPYAGPQKGEFLLATLQCLSMCTSFGCARTFLFSISVDWPFSTLVLPVQLSHQACPYQFQIVFHFANLFAISLRLVTKTEVLLSKLNAHFSLSLLNDSYILFCHVHLVAFMRICPSTLHAVYTFMTTSHCKSSVLDMYDRHFCSMLLVSPILTAPSILTFHHLICRLYLGWFYSSWRTL